MPPTPLDTTGERWWFWNGHTVDLAAESGAVPSLVRVAILAHRDAETDEDTDMADVLAWLVEEHPPWAGSCPACGTRDACAVQRNAQLAITAWLIDRTQRLVARIRADLTDRRRSARVPR